MKKYQLALLTVALLCGCATNKGNYKTEADVERRLTGMSKDDVITDLGAPTKKATLTNGNETWRYESEVGGLAGGECTLALQFEGDKVARAKLSAHDLSWVSFPLGSCTKIIQTLR